MKNDEILKHILKNLEIQTSDIIKCYIYGSRLFKTNKPDADYDIFLILDGFVGPLKSETSPVKGLYEKLVFLEDLQLDIFVYELSFWNYKLEQNVVENISYFSIPKEYIIYDSSKKLKFELNYMKLKHSIDSYLGIHLQKATRTLKIGTFHVSKKVCIHCIRAVKFAIQIAQKGIIYDYECANEEFKIIQKLKDEKEEILIWFFDIMYPLEMELRTYLNVYKSISPFKPFTDRESKFITKNTKLIKKEDESKEEWKGIFIIDYIKKGRNPKDLEKYLDLTFSSFRKNLTHVSINTSTTRQSKLADQCLGLIYNSQSLDIVCYPFDRFQNHHCSQLFELDWKNVEITEKLNGLNVNMFYLEKNWEISIYKGNSSLSNHFLLTQYLSEIYNLFWETWKELKYQLPSEKSNTYMFLFQPKLNKSRIILVGVREMKNYTECDIMKYQQFELPKKLEINDLSKENDPFKYIINLCNKLNPLEYEGYVVRDIKSQRITFKSDLYKFLEETNEFERLSHIQEFFFKFILKIMFYPEWIETFYYWYPKWKPYFNDIYFKILDVFKKTKDTFDLLEKDFPEKKDFIRESKKYSEITTILFDMKSRSFDRVMDVFREERTQFKLKDIIFK